MRSKGVSSSNVLKLPTKISFRRCSSENTKCVAYTNMVEGRRSADSESLPFSSWKIPLRVSSDSGISSQSFESLDR